MSDSAVLIAGGAGFLGSHLCDRILAEGHDVICVDNFISGSRANISHLLDNPHFQLIEHDIIQPLTVERKLSAIFHFASPASPNPASSVSYMAHPIETLMVNSVGTHNLLELARHHNCQIVLASTSEIYGDPAVHPQPEEYFGHVSPNGPRSCYDEGKRFLEAISFAYYRKFGTQIKVIRIFNTYGPRMILDEGRFVPALVASVLRNIPFNLHGDGSATRSFCYVDDLIRGIYEIYSHPEAVGQVINLGNPEEFTLTAAIAVIEQITGKKLTINHLDSPIDDPQRRCPDITKAKKLLSWQPTVPLSEGLQKMLESYEK